MPRRVDGCLAAAMSSVVQPTNRIAIEMKWSIRAIQNMHAPNCFAFGGGGTTNKLAVRILFGNTNETKGEDGKQNDRAEVVHGGIR